MEAGFIDPPSPFATLAEWERFAAEMERLAGTQRHAAEMLREARRVIAEKKSAAA